MSAQLEYNATPAVALPGMIGEHFSLRQIDSYVVGGEDVIPFGYPIVQDATDGTARIGDSPNSTFVGISVFAQQLNYSDALGYAPKDQIPVMKRGRIWVRVGEAVVMGEAVFGGITGDGLFYNDSDGDTRINVGGVFRSSAALNGLALIEFGF